MKRHLQCAEQQVSLSNLTKYCACHAERLTCLVLIACETSFTVRGATGVTIQPHQILRLPRKMTLQDVKENLQKQVKRHFHCGADPTMIREWSDHDPSMIRAWKRKPQPASQVRLLCEVPRSIFYYFHQILRLPRKVPLERHQVLRLPQKVTLELHQLLRLPRKVTLELHQVLRLPRKMIRLLYRPHIWNVISNARSNTCHYPTSPNTAPATKNDTARCQRKSPKTGETSFPLRGRSDHDPRMIRPWSEHDPTQVRLLCEVPRSIFYCKIQRFAPNLTLKLSPNTAPATKSATWPSPSTAPATKSSTGASPSTAPATKSDTRTSPSIAPATKSDTWTSPSTAPATKSDTWTSPSTTPATKSDTWTSPSTAPATVL